VATDATGTPTSLGIPKFNTSVDAPSGLGTNAMMDEIDTLIAARIAKPSAPSSGDALVWNGTSWDKSSGATKVAVAGLAPGTEGYSLQVVSGVPAWAATAASSFAGVKVYRTANQAATGGGVVNKVQWDNEEFDTDAFHDNVTNNTRLTVPSGKAGKYLVMAHFRMSGTTGGTDDRIEIMKNNATVAYEFAKDSGAFNNFRISEVFDLAVADYIEINMVRVNAAAATAQGGQTDFRASMIKVG
jgi:hypothetical protein